MPKRFKKTKQGLIKFEQKPRLYKGFSRYAFLKLGWKTYRWAANLKIGDVVHGGVPTWPFNQRIVSIKIKPFSFRSGYVNGREFILTDGYQADSWDILPPVSVSWIKEKVKLLGNTREEFEANNSMFMTCMPYYNWLYLVWSKVVVEGQEVCDENGCLLKEYQYTT